MLCVVDRLMSETADVNIQSSVGMFIFCGLLHGQFLADRTNGRAIGTVLRLSSSVVCNAKYCR